MEKTSHPQPLLFEVVGSVLVTKFRENRISLISSYIFGLLAHMFAFTNKLMNGDDVYNLFYKGATIESGRWGLGFWDCIFPNYSMPWIYGLITITLIAVSVCLILRIFSITNPTLQVLLGGCILAFPSLVGTFTFMYTSSSYALSFLLCVLGVWFVHKYPKIGIFPSMVCIIGSLSIYQAYISIAASLFVILLIQQLLKGDDLSLIIRRGFLFLSTLILSLGLYYLATQIILVLKDVHFNNYSSTRITFRLSTLSASIHLAYSNFLLFFENLSHSLIPTSFSQKVHYLLFAALLVLLFLWAISQKNKQPLRYLFLAVFLLLLPLAINCMYLFTSVDAIHTLVLYGFSSIYVFSVVIVDACIPLPVVQKIAETAKKTALNAVMFALACIIVINVYIANEAYLCTYLRYENTYSFYSSLTADIKMMPEFDENTKLAVIGNWESPNYMERQFEFTHYLFGISGMTPDSYAADRFLEYYLGFPILFASQSEIQAISQSEEFTQMKTYPYYGSMKMFDNILVVKLS